MPRDSRSKQGNRIGRICVRQRPINTGDNGESNCENGVTHGHDRISMPRKADRSLPYETSRRPHPNRLTSGDASHPHQIQLRRSPGSPPAETATRPRFAAPGPRSPNRTPLLDKPAVAKGHFLVDAGCVLHKRHVPVSSARTQAPANAAPSARARRETCGTARMSWRSTPPTLRIPLFLAKLSGRGG